MCDIGNMFIVVEYDEDMMMVVDYFIDIGLGVGEYGGWIVVVGILEEVVKNKNFIIGDYFLGKKFILVFVKCRKGNGLELEIIGVKVNNFKNVNVKILLVIFFCVIGVLGLGKSLLVNEVLWKVLVRKLNRNYVKLGEYKEIKGIENLEKIINID